MELASLEILVVAAHEGQGSVHLDKLLPALRRMGARVRYAGWDRRRIRPPSFTADGVEFTMIYRGWGYANWRLLLAIPLWMAHVLAHLFRQRADVVIAFDFDAGLPMAIVNLVTGRPYIYNVRDNYALRWWVPTRLQPLVERFDSWVMSRSILVIVPDESRVPESAAGRATFAIIRNCALDVEIPVPPNDDERPFTVYAMGYLRDSRGMNMLLRALDRLPDMHVIAAGDCHEPDLLHRLQTHPRVDYHGQLPVEEALKLCGLADVIFTFYAPTAEINIRAISNKWSDAMMAGKPILVNKEVLKSRWIEEEDIGYSCAYDDDDLVAIIRHMQANPEERRRKGRNGRRLYDEGYNWPAMEALLEAELRRACARLETARR